MFTLVAFVAVIGLYWALLYRGMSLKAFAGVTAAVVAGLYFTGAIGGLAAALVAVLVIAPAALLSVGSVRRALLTGRIYKVFRSIMPEMNSTEKEALEAGDVWWEGEMFRGKPDWSKLLDFQYTQLTAEEQRFLDNETSELCGMIDDWQVHFELKDLPEEIWDYIREKGFFAMLISKEHGGLGFSAFAQSCVVSKIATRSLTAAVTVMVPNSLGPGELLVHYGTPEQQKRWLPGLISGKEIPCFALTGVEAGSDATAMPDTGVVEKREIDGREVLGLRLNFNKRYITLAPVATLVGLAFKLEDPNGLLGDADKVDYGITCALIPADTPGVDTGRRHYPGAAFMNGPVRGKDVFVPLDSIIGGPEQAGGGWRMLVECLSAGRGISLPALSTATGKGMYGVTAAYSRVRRQFGVSIGKFEGVQESMGRIGGYAYIMEASRNLTASAVDHCSPSVVTAMMKYHMTEMMREVLNDSMDIHSGKGIQMGPRNYLAAPYQAAPVAITVEGANIMTRNLMVFGQGAIRCHPYTLQEMEAANNPDYNAGLASFDEAFMGHIGYAINRAVRAFTLGLTGGRIASTPVDSQLKNYYRDLEHFSASLAFASDVAMGTLGGALKFKERISARLGDMLSHLYMASAVLKYYEANGATDVDAAHATWALEHHLHEIENALYEVSKNFPVPGVGGLLRTVCLPLGRRFDGPSDALNAKVCEYMMSGQPADNLVQRFGYDMYLNPSEHDPKGILLLAVEKLDAIEPEYEALLKAVKKGDIKAADIDGQLAQAVDQGLFSQAKADAIREYDRLRYEIICTDDFTQEYIKQPLDLVGEHGLRAAS